MAGWIGRGLDDRPLGQRPFRREPVVHRPDPSGDARRVVTEPPPGHTRHIVGAVQAAQRVMPRSAFADRRVAGDAGRHRRLGASGRDGVDPHAGSGQACGRSPHRPPTPAFAAASASWFGVPNCATPLEWKRRVQGWLAGVPACRRRGQSPQWIPLPRRPARRTAHACSWRCGPGRRCATRWPRSRRSGIGLPGCGPSPRSGCT